MSEEQEQQEQQEQPAEDNNIGSSLMTALFDVVEEKKPEEEEQAPEEEPSEPQAEYPQSPTTLGDALNMQSEEPQEEAPEEEPQPEPEPEETKEETERLEKLDNSLFSSEEIEAPKEKAKEEPKEELKDLPPPEEEPKEEENFTDDQVKRLEIAKYAEDNFSEYKGLSAKYKDFFRKQKEYLEKRLTEDPEAQLDDTDHEYQAFLKRNQPVFTQDDMEKVIEKRTMEKAKEEAVKEIEPEIQRIKEEQRRQKILPEVNRLKDQTVKEIGDIIPEEMKAFLDEHGLDKAKEEDPVRFDIIDKIATAHRDSMFAFHEITQGLTPYDPSNQTHIRLATWLDQMQATMPDKDGKKFVPIQDYQALTKKEQAKSYTITPEDVLKSAKDAAKRYINSEINALDERLRKSGYVKSTATEQTQSVQPKPRKPVPRQGHTANVEKQKEDKKNSVASVLGY